LKGLERGVNEERAAKRRIGSKQSREVSRYHLQGQNVRIS